MTGKVLILGSVQVAQVQFVFILLQDADHMLYDVRWYLPTFVVAFLLDSVAKLPTRS